MRFFIVSVCLVTFLFVRQAFGLECSSPNEVYLCGSACDTTCATLGEPCPIVNIRCNDACYCMVGYARNEDDICIPISECNSSSTS